MSSHRARTVIRVRRAVLAVVCVAATLAVPAVAVAATSSAVPATLVDAIERELGPAAVRPAAVATAGTRLDSGDGGDLDHFGISVAVSGDTAVVGSNNHSPGGNFWAGSAYVYVRQGGGWVRQAELNAADGGSTDRFGSAVAISGDTIVVGSQSADTAGGGNAGAAYVFTRTGTAWTQQAKLTSADGAAADWFGYSVAVDGDTALIGVYADDTVRGTDSGSAYVFSRTGTTWSQQASLTAGDGAAYDILGCSVALSNGTAVVGAWGDETAAGDNAGSAYIYTRSGTTWSQRAKLTAADAAGNDYFGNSVAISGSTVVVGAYWKSVGARSQAGAAYVFTGSGSTWSQQASLTAGDAAAGDWFANSLSVSGDVVAVGAPAHATVAGADAGAAYLFTRSGTTWSRGASVTLEAASSPDRLGTSVALFQGGVLAGGTHIGSHAGAETGAVASYASDTWAQEQVLTPGDGRANDLFGWSVDVSGDTAVVGAHDHDGSRGAAYVFERLGRAWVPSAELTATDAAAGDWFGWSVGIDGDWIVVGAPREDTLGSDAGCAYFFERTATGWVQRTRVYQYDNQPQVAFGGSVAISGDRAVVGGKWFNSPGPSGREDVGSAWVFQRSGAAWDHAQTFYGSQLETAAEFGSAVDIEGDRLIVGAQNADLGGVTDAGLARVFLLAGTSSSTVEATLTFPGAAASDHAGGAVAISGDRAVVGARMRDGVAGVNAGAASVHTRSGSGSGWSTGTVITPLDASSEDHFGSGVAISGDTIVVGADGDDSAAGDDTGAMYVFKPRLGGWQESGKLVAADAAAGDSLGGAGAVAISGETVLGGAREADTYAGSNAGAAYLFGPVPTVTRVAGSDRYAVAANLAYKGWNADAHWGETTHVIVACGDPGKEADPLAAAGLAGAYDCPILLTKVASLPSATRSAITSMAAAPGHSALKVHIVGGTGSVPDAIWNQIKAIPGVSATKDRITGSDRYAVTAAIAYKMRSVLGTDAIPGALIVCSENPNAFYDALAASPIAFAQHRPMLGVRTTAVPSSVGNALRSPLLAGKPRHVVSSSTYISAGTYTLVGGTGNRLTTSSNRYTAATQIAARAHTEGWLDYTDTGMASALADALGGGAFMGNAGGILLYTTPTSSIQSTTRTWIDSNSDDITRGWIFGGTGSVPESQRTAFLGLLQ